MPFASQAVSRDPEMLRARLLYARCLIANGDAQGARYQLHEVEDRAHDHPAVAAIEQLLKDQTAVASATSATADAPAKPAAAADTATPTPVENLNYDASIARGQNALESGQVQLAKRLFEQALFLHPNSPQAHTGLGYVALEKSRPVLAMEHFNAAARAGNDEALIGLADAYRRLGRTRDAVRAYQNYVNRSPNGRQVSIARAQLDRLSDDNGPVRKGSP
jgi:tetratricopeptide (TPR) repeat protein